MCAQPDASRILRLVEEINDSTIDATIEDQVRRYYDQRLSDETRTTLKAIVLGCAPQDIERTSALVVMRLMA